MDTGFETSVQYIKCKLTSECSFKYLPSILEFFEKMFMVQGRSFSSVFRVFDVLTGSNLHETMSSSNRYLRWLNAAPNIKQRVVGYSLKPGGQIPFAD